MWTAFKPWREIPVDMSGFAVNLDLILTHPEAEFVASQKDFGTLESDFLMKLGIRNFTELEPKADGCKRVSDVMRFVAATVFKE